MIAQRLGLLGHLFFPVGDHRRGDTGLSRRRPPTPEGGRLDLSVDLAGHLSRDTADFRQAEQGRELGGYLRAAEPMQRNQDIVDTGIEIESGRQRPGSHFLIVEKNMVAAVIVAIRREQVEYSAPEAFDRLLRSAQPAAEAHEIFVVNGAIRCLAVHHAAEGMDVPPADGQISPAVTVKTFDREMAALAIIYEAGARQADAGVPRHQPKGKLHRTLGFFARPGKFQDAGAVTGRRSAPDENLMTLDEFPF